MRQKIHEQTQSIMNADTILTQRSHSIFYFRANDWICFICRKQELWINEDGDCFHRLLMPDIYIHIQMILGSHRVICIIGFISSALLIICEDWFKYSLCICNLSIAMWVVKLIASKFYRYIWVQLCISFTKLNDSCP